MVTAADVPHRLAFVHGRQLGSMSWHGDVKVLIHVALMGSVMFGGPPMIAALSANKPALQTNSGAHNTEQG